MSGHEKSLEAEIVVIDGIVDAIKAKLASANGGTSVNFSVMYHTY